MYAQDSVEFEVYVMVWKKGILNQKVEVERMENKERLVFICETQKKWLSH